MTFKTRAAARAYLAAKGMVLNYPSVLSDLDREYWWFTDRANRLLDHSATITRCGDVFAVSDFSGA